LGKIAENCDHNIGPWANSTAKAISVRVYDKPLLDQIFIPELRAKASGLPDFSWHNIPKRGKIYQIITPLPNDHKIYLKIFQMSIKQTGIFHSKALHNLPKLVFLV
jgi:hypothetical protein